MTQVKIDVGKVSKINQDHILAEARGLHARWPMLSHESKRSIVQTITSAVVVGKDSIDIRLEYLPQVGKSVDKGADGSCFALSRAPR